MTAEVLAAGAMPRGPQVPSVGRAMTAYLTHLVQAYGYYAVFVLIALESMGVPLPGETGLIAAAIYAGSTHHLNVVALAAVAAAAAIIGDNAGYWIGRTGGLTAGRALRALRAPGPDQAQGRALSVRPARGEGRRHRAVHRRAPDLRRALRRHRRHALAPLPGRQRGGRAAWSCFYAFGAYALGSAASGVSSALTIAGYVLASVVTVATAVLVRVMLRRLERSAEAAFPDQPPAAQAPPRPQVITG